MWAIVYWFMARFVTLLNVLLLDSVCMIMLFFSLSIVRKAMDGDAISMVPLPLNVLKSKLGSVNHGDMPEVLYASTRLFNVFARHLLMFSSFILFCGISGYVLTYVRL